MSGGLVIRELEVDRGAGPVVSGVNLAIEPGTITAIVGPNGAGKTSLLEAISGLLTSTRGAIEIDGEDIVKLSRRQRAARGLVHVEQNRAIFPSLTVRENLELVNSDISAVLEAFPELDKRLTSAAGLLSGGEQQMVVLGRALVATPKFLMIDEMSSGLAPVVVQRLLPIVERFRDAGVGVLLVEQFAHLALRIASRGIVITSGQVTYSGAAAALLSDEALLHRSYLGE